jgi:hypothetical protein
MRLISRAERRSSISDFDYSGYSRYFEITRIIRITGVARRLGRPGSETGRSGIIAKAGLQNVATGNHLAKQNPHVFDPRAG